LKKKKKAMNNKIWKLTITSLLAFIVIFSCSSYKSIDGGLLWKITGNGLKEPSYLLGTNHGMSGDFVDSISGFWDAFNSVEQLVMEYDITKPKRLDSIKPINILPEDITYHDLLDADEIAVLDSILLVYFPYNSREIRLLKPASLRTLLQGAILIKESQKWATENPYLAIAITKSIDLRLLKISKFRSYPIIELDSEKELDSLGIRDRSFLSSSENLQLEAKEMLQSLTSSSTMDSIIGFTRNSIEVYYTQNLRAIEKYDTDPKMQNEKEAKLNRNTFIIKRNILWIDKILPAINKKPSFIMVGVAHLPGKKGLINLLKKEGYTVQPIK
jgi:uncharacterized protein YbaP (TraB family)